MPDLSPLLTVRGLSKSFAGVPALSGAFLEISRGEVHAVVGQNGAGKSTLIKVLTGYYSRDSGEIVFDGMPLDLTSPHQAQLRGISTIYQEINLVGYRSVTENICLGRSFERWGMLDWPRMHRTARELLARFNIDIDVRKPLEDFPVAIQQMVAIARAVGFSSKLVIMDEPTSSLEEREVDILFGVIRQLRREGVSIIFVSHKLDELYEVCDRVTILRDGVTVRSSAIADIDKLELVATMLGRDINTVQRKGQTAFGPRHEGQHGMVLSVQHLSALPRVADVSLDVGRGEIVGLAGLLGSGRTDTVRLIFGADPLDGGSMSLLNKPFAPGEPRAAIRAGVGFCTEDRKSEGIVPDLSVGENLTLALLPALVRGGVVDTGEQRRVIKDMVARLGIKCASIDQPIKQLSGGNQQKVLLARWLCMNPRLLILDEPTRGIDVGAKAEIQSLVAGLAEKGVALLMVSSEIEEIAEGADRAYVLRDGQTVAELSDTDLNEQNLLNAMAHGRDYASKEIAQ
jgi:galactofuranose transport system ATP-binding protein